MLPIKPICFASKSRRNLFVAAISSYHIRYTVVYSICESANELIKREEDVYVDCNCIREVFRTVVYVAFHLMGGPTDCLNGLREEATH